MTTTSDASDFRHRLRVRYAETDAGGVAHHSSYVAWLEEARTEWMRARGRTYREVEDAGFFLLVTELTLRYLSPARYDDEVQIAVREVARKRVSLTLAYDLTMAADGRRVAEATTTLACIDASGKVRRLPDGV